MGNTKLNVTEQGPVPPQSGPLELLKDSGDQPLRSYAPQRTQRLCDGLLPLLNDQFGSCGSLAARFMRNHLAITPTFSIHSRLLAAT